MVFLAYFYLYFRGCLPKVFPVYFHYHFGTGVAPKEHRITNYVNKIDRALLGWVGSDEPTGGWSKGALTTALCQFLQYFCEIRSLETSQDETIQLIVPLHHWFLFQLAGVCYHFSGVERYLGLIMV